MMILKEQIYGKLRMKGVTVIILTGILALGQCEDHEHTLENVALRGKASQSSQYNCLAEARNAIDGRRDSEYTSGSCTHTKIQDDPWWRVDLLNVYSVTSVTITNRGDCCSERINGAQIRIGNSMENNGNNNTLCAVVSTIPAGKSITFQCHGMEGRYVNVFQPGSSEVLTLCEVEVNASSVPGNMVMDPVTSDGDEFTEPKCRVTTPDNAATGGKATQSSTQHYGGADRAIDRNRSPLYDAQTCTHTTVEKNPWWRVDLLRKHRVTSVTVTNRADCCASRLDGAEIRVGDSLENNGNDNPVCAGISHIKGGESVTFQCHGMEGRYVNVFLPGREKVLTLCEVEVDANVIHNENVALRGKASQSSQYNCLAEARNAIDGRHDSEYTSGSCTHTKIQDDPWWRVDLLNVYSVTSVTITNRGDCCSERINGAQIRIGNSMENNGNNNTLCAVVSTIPAGKSITFQCHGMEGRYVNVFQPGSSEVLTLCEVEVNASSVPGNMVMDPVTSDGDEFTEPKCRVTTPDNAATGGKATQSSTQHYGGADRAIDRNRSPLYDAQTCTHTTVEKNPWWRVDLLRKHRVTSVTVTNRADCCASRLDGAEIRVGDSLENNGNDNPVCAGISHIKGGESVTFQCHEMEGRYVNVFLPGRGRVLTLCEVEVNGSAVLNGA
ncbi:uncharacterized protein LOC135259686 [Anguilla rostrata]|uniref:uncharacterized protein LOC135259686 n=1 Tax=Anguilla rostrata TaxID=7938 RepID=UPI0030CF7B7C